MIFVVVVVLPSASYNNKSMKQNLTTKKKKNTELPGCCRSLLFFNIIKVLGQTWRYFYVHIMYSEKDGGNVLFVKYICHLQIKEDEVSALYIEHFVSI